MVGKMNDDMTHCVGEGCPWKHECERFHTLHPILSTNIIYYFMKVPYDEKNKTCEYFLEKKENAGKC